MGLFPGRRKRDHLPEIGIAEIIFPFFNVQPHLLLLYLLRSPIGGTLPGRKHRSKTIKDSGSSGPDRDKSSGSRRSEKTKSRERIGRKPSKELLRIQNYTDSSDDDFRVMARFSKRRSSRSNDTRSQSNDNSGKELKDDNNVILDATSSKTDIASSLSPSSSKRSPNISRQSPKSNHSPKRSSRISKQSPETLRRKTPPPPTKSLNMQIHEFVQHSSRSPPKMRKKMESGGNNFDAFNHTSSSKLSHASFKEHEKSPNSKQSSLSQQYSSQYSESFEDYEIYHPRRSSKEVLDFTSSRKSLQDKSSENEQYPKRQQSKDEKRNSRHDEESFKNDEFIHCHCLSPRKETSNEIKSPSLLRDEKDVFDFTSKKLSPYSGGTLSRRSKHRDSSKKESEIYSSGSTKSPRKREDRAAYDLGVGGDGSEYATLRKKKHSHRHKANTEALYKPSNSGRNEAEGQLLSCPSQELLKSSSEFLVSKSASRELLNNEDSWLDSSRSRRTRVDVNKDDFDHIFDSKADKSDFDKNILKETTIDPPDLFNTNKNKAENELFIGYSQDLEDSQLQSSMDAIEPIYISRSATLKHSHKHRSKRIRNRSLEMVLDESDSKSRYLHG